MSIMEDDGDGGGGWSCEEEGQGELRECGKVRKK